MKSFKRFLKEDWWDDLGPEGQEAYISAHPNSAKAKSAKAEAEKTNPNKIKTTKTETSDSNKKNENKSKKITSKKEAISHNKKLLDENPNLVDDVADAIENELGAILYTSDIEDILDGKNIDSILQNAYYDNDALKPSKVKSILKSYGILDTSKYEGEYTPSPKKSSNDSLFGPKWSPCGDMNNEELHKKFKAGSFGSKDAMNELMDRDEMTSDEYSLYIKKAEDDWNLGDLQKGFTSKKFSSKNIDEFVNKTNNENYIRFLLGNPNLTKDNLKNMYNKAKKIGDEYTIKAVEDTMKKMENK